MLKTIKSCSGTMIIEYCQILQAFQLAAIQLGLSASMGDLVSVNIKHIIHIHTCIYINILQSMLCVGLGFNDFCMCVYNCIRYIDTYIVLRDALEQIIGGPSKHKKELLFISTILLQPLSLSCLDQRKAMNKKIVMVAFLCAVQDFHNPSQRMWNVYSVNNA